MWIRCRERLPVAFSVGPKLRCVKVFLLWRQHMKDPQATTGGSAQPYPSCSRWCPRL